MRIAIVTETWLPSINGMTTRLSVTVRELLAHGHEVLIIAPVSAGESFCGAAVQTVPSFRSKRFYGAQPFGLPVPHVAFIIRRFNPDIVHVANPAGLGMMAMLAARIQRRPTVCSYHTDVASYAKFYRLGLLVPIIWFLLRFVHNLADINMATSDSALRQLASHGVRRLHRWERGVDSVAFRPRGNKQVGDSKGRIRVVYVGRLAPEKNLDVLVGVAQAAGMHLTLVGDGPYRAALTEKLTNTSATFTGMLTGDQLTDALAAADVFVFPSTTETLGLVILEALSAGLPIVAMESPASRELLAECAAARLCPADSPALLPSLIAELIGSAPVDELAERAREQVANNSWADATAGLVGVYEGVLSARG